MFCCHAAGLTWAEFWWQSLHSLRHGDPCQENQTDDNTSGINTEVKVNGQKLETVTSFKYLGSVINDEGSKPEILSRIAQTTAALTRLKPVWNDRTISLSSKIQLCSRVTSIFLYACESWTTTVKLLRRIQAMEILQDTMHLIQRPYYQRGSPCQDPAGNQTTQRPPDHRKETQTAVIWSCLLFIRSGQNHLARHSERGKKTGWQKKRWEDNIREWTGLEFAKSQRAVENMEKNGGNWLRNHTSWLRNRWDERRDSCTGRI